MNATEQVRGNARARMPSVISAASQGSDGTSFVSCCGLARGEACCRGGRRAWLTSVLSVSLLRMSSFLTSTRSLREGLEFEFVFEGETCFVFKRGA